MNNPSMPGKRRFRWWVSRIMAGALVFVLLLSAVTWIAGARAKSTMRKHNPPPGQLVDVGGYKMHINCLGQGDPTVILAAGLDDFSIFWSLVQPEAARITRVCSFDRAGLGWSESSHHPRTIENMVEELHALLINAGVAGPYVLVGHSFGGAQIRLYAHKYPGHVAGMVLVDAAPDELFDRIPAWARPIGLKLRLYRTLAPMYSLGLLGLAPANIPNRGLPEQALEQYRAIAASTPYYRIAIAENEAFEENLAEVRAAGVGLMAMPFVVISRGYWAPIPGLSDSENRQAWQAWQEMQLELLGSAPRGRLIIASQSEHSIHLQQPQLVVDAIFDVVKSTRR